MNQETQQVDLLPDWSKSRYQSMSIRAYMSIQIMQALVSRTGMSPKILAKQAILLTDALLEELEKSKN